MDERTAFLAQDGLKAKRETLERIPLVDLAPLRDGSDKQAVAKEIAWACSNIGFFYVKNHGVSEDFVAETFSAVQNFFALPEPQKMELHLPKSGLAMRGYTPLYGENTDPEKTQDYKEVFDIGPEPGLGERAPAGGYPPFFGPNLMPDGHPKIAQQLQAYHDTMVALSRIILRGVALSLDLDEGFFNAKMQRPISIQRFLHYPPQKGAVEEAELGCGAHSDYGNLTILAQDKVGGLQILNRDGSWIEAAPIPGTFVINIGELMQRLTNDRYIANLHRVINLSGRERYSMPFFVEADPEAVFEPLPSCCDRDNPPHYGPTTCGEHMFRRYSETFVHLEQV